MIWLVLAGAVGSVLGFYACRYLLRVRWDERRAVVWLLDRDGSAIPTRLMGTDCDRARVIVQCLTSGATIGLGLRFDDGRVVRHHFGEELDLEELEELSVPLPRAFLPG